MGFVIEPGNGSKCKTTGEHEYWEEYSQPGLFNCIHCGKPKPSKLSSKERLKKLESIIEN